MRASPFRAAWSCVFTEREERGEGGWGRGTTGWGGVAMVANLFLALVT